jgi:hypothetical protein
MWKQVQFGVTNPDLQDEDSDNIFGGIAEYMEDVVTGDLVLIRIICGCCGYEFEPNDVMILDIYDEWMDLTKTIVGN